ncbi:heavy-metal-associated domain-containing protein [Nocardia veterana]|uniref:Heavy-metal-associated domain-containing protein n=1 Tax=Nocardia veterana TaxID=132249 RepID=A0A7X6M3L2_9NOCA|nr:heavy-metal-associated domain-containing protein [Nocardia veterana]NKY89567.1 heavy-metal-associated domain-containing protein [Nocardia veterana]
MIEHSYAVLGMACGHCAASVTAEIEHIPGVTAVAVDVAADTVRVTSAADLDPADIRAAVDAAGYELAAPDQSAGEANSHEHGPRQTR